jgi:UDP-N-acetylglucosamine/UDP-N-acetylgalactosamine diphosphorylase
MTQRSREEWSRHGVEIAAEVDLSRIADDAVIHPGSRIKGAETSIGPGSVIGAEAPAVVADCRLGRSVELKGGYFCGAVFFDGASMGSGAHVRSGTILEEEAGGAHTVGFKQTVLLPFVTAGSLINFCDALMAGGTSRKNHSEIGSSYVHFNYTPHQDKATPSLIGNVPGGVFLDRQPIFLGGLGGLVGPARIAFGSVIAAGGVCREDIAEENQLHVPAAPRSKTRPYETGTYRGIGRIVRNNLAYIGNIIALREWYRQIRVLFVRDMFDQAVLDGGLQNLELILSERIRRLGQLAEKLPDSVRNLQSRDGAADEMAVQQAFCTAWPQVKAGIEGVVIPPAPEAFTQALNTKENYITSIQSLDPTVRETGRCWLESIVESIEHVRGS